MSNHAGETGTEASDAAVAEESPAPFVMLAGDDESLCIDELCVTPAPTEGGAP